MQQIDIHHNPIEMPESTLSSMVFDVNNGKTLSNSEVRQLLDHVLYLKSYSVEDLEERIEYLEEKLDSHGVTYL